MGNAAPGWGVIEIGTGIGVLTCELARRADKVTAIEIDTRLMPVLQETLAEFDNIRIVNEDVLKVDLHRLIQEDFPGMPVAVCANLPYYITSPILMMLLESRLPIRSITVMVQKEAAARICALPGTRDVGAVSIAVRYFSEPKLLFSVSRGSFMPAPNVDSAVIRLDVREQTPPGVEDERFFFRVVKAAFSQRRTALGNPLSAGLCLPKDQVLACMERAEVPFSARAEQLSMEQFVRLANELYNCPLSKK